MANPRLLIEQTLAPGAEIALEEGQARHVGQVLRLEAGDALRAFNARDGEWRARVAEKTKRGMRIAIVEKLREARSVPDLDLLFAPVKRHATDLIVEKATELGAVRIRPIITQRTIAETVRADRLAAIAREAAEQTERFDAPEILDPLPLLKALDGWDQTRPLIFADEAGEAPPMLAALHYLLPRGGGVGEEGRSAAQAPDRLNAPHPLPPSPRGRGNEVSSSAPRAASRPGGATPCGRSLSSARFRSARASCAPRQP